LTEKLTKYLNNEISLNDLVDWVERMFCEADFDKKEKIISKLKDFFRVNFSRYYIDMVFLYGSWASGYPREDSDLDLAVVFSKEINKEDDIFSMITEISYELEKDLDTEVNIICVHRDFRRPMLYYNAIVLGMPVFIKDKDKFLNLKMEAISQMEEFRIFGIPWQREVARKALSGGRDARI